MEKPLEELSASSLRNLLIKEVKLFTASLDNAVTEELEKKKLFLRRIYELIQQKEKAESAPLNWGKKSTSVSPEIFMSPPISDSTPSAASGYLPEN